MAYHSGLRTLALTSKSNAALFLVPTKTNGTKRPIFGSLKDRITINDVNWWKPMTEDEVESFVDGQRAIVKLYNDLKVIW